MPADRFIDALNEQIAAEFSASHQYAAIAMWYESHTLPQLASFFYAQAVEERNHAMMMAKYLLYTDAQVDLNDIAAPDAEFGDHGAPITLALNQEREVSGRISDLFALAREEGDYLSEQFMQWFLKEQVEEVDLFSSLLAVGERSRERPNEIEEYIAREAVGGGGADPSAPPVAGAG